MHGGAENGCNLRDPGRPRRCAWGRAVLRLGASLQLLPEIALKFGAALQKRYRHIDSQYHFCINPQQNETFGSILLTINRGASSEKSGNFSSMSCSANRLRGGGDSQPASKEPALTLAKAFFASYDASLATAIPASGATAAALTDGCSLHNGYSKALGVSDYDADTLRVASRQFDIGSIRSAITVTDDRTITNPNNTVRREIDVQYVIDYRDGTKDEKATQTLITGSSAGSTLADGSACAASQDSADLRFFGNRKIANTFVNASNEREERYQLATGLVIAPKLFYNRYITLGVRDPAKIATYATISGPGLTSAPGVPATFKMVSPRLLRDDPLFAGKVGNFVDWRDTDTFRICRTPTGGLAAADVADCVTNGAATDRFGHFGATDPLVQDTAFNALGITAGGVYTVKLYAGTGWKTVNGQAAETPIATYTRTLENLPMSTVTLAATMGGGGSASAPATGVSSPIPGASAPTPVASAPTPVASAPLPPNFPKFVTSSMTVLDIATNVRNKTAFSTDLTWIAPVAMPDGRKTGLNLLYSFEQGRASSGATFNPASRQFSPSYPASTATAATLNVPAPVPALVSPTYFEAALEYTNRNGNYIKSVLRLQ